MNKNNRFIQRKVDRFCSAGVSLSDGRIQLVVIAGAGDGPQEIYCAEHLAAPHHLILDSSLIKPLELGAWLKKYLIERDLEPQHISFSVSQTEVSSCELTLPAELSQEDLAFQLTAELLQGHLELADQFSVDYQAVDVDATTNPSGNVAYRAAMIKSEHLTAFKQCAKAASLPIYAIETSASALQRLMAFGEFLNQSHVTAAGVLLCQEACGLALSPWAQDEAFNFYPYRLELLQRQHRHWAFQMLAGLGLGVLLSATLSACLAYKAEAVMGNMTEGHAISQALSRSKLKQQALQQTLDKKIKAQEWLDSHNEKQRQAQIWHLALSQMGSGIWISDIQVQHANWVIQGESLSAESVHQAIEQLGALPVWVQKPALEQLKLSSEAAMPVWGFKALGELKGG